MVNRAARRNRSVVSSQPKTRLAMTWIELVVMLIILVILAVLLLTPVSSSRPTGRRTQCRNNLKQIMLALYNYHDDHGAFPPAYTTDSAGRRLHSWRTLILPNMQVDEQMLYKTIDLTKPWDDPANLSVSRTTPIIYRCPTFPGDADQTTYLAVVTDASCLRPDKSCSRSEITDDPGQTLFIVEAPNNQSVHWMSPNDADEQLILGLGSTTKSTHEGGFHAGLADGSVRYIPVGTPATTRRAMITVSGGEKVSEF